MADSKSLMGIVFFIMFVFVMAYGLNLSLINNNSIAISGSNLISGSQCSNSSFSSLNANPNLIPYAPLSENGQCASTLFTADNYDCSACTNNPFGPSIGAGAGNTGPCTGLSCANTGPCVGPTCSGGVSIGTTGTGPLTPGSNPPSCCIKKPSENLAVNNDWTCGISDFIRSLSNVLIGVINMLMVGFTYFVNFFVVMFGPCSIFNGNGLLAAVILVPLVIGALYIIIQALKP